MNAIHVLNQNQNLQDNHTGEDHVIGTRREMTEVGCNDIYLCQKQKVKSVYYFPQR